jgi:hypothetical protein
LIDNGKCKVVCFRKNKDRVRPCAPVYSTYRLGIKIMKLEKCFNVLSKFLEKREKDRGGSPPKYV